MFLCGNGGGAASIAYEEFGAEWGVGVGMTGQCYAIPTMDGSIDIIRKHVDNFTAYAKAHPELTFLVTRIGCGIAGWRDSEIAPLFKEASALDNVTLPGRVLECAWIMKEDVTGPFCKRSFKPYESYQ